MKEFKCFLCGKADDESGDYLGSLDLCHDCGKEFCDRDQPRYCFKEHKCPALRQEEKPKS